MLKKEVKKLTNTNELRAAITRKGMTQEQVADILKISVQTMNYKVNNKREFKATEIKALIDLLEIPEDKVNMIFFAGDVDF